MVRVENPIVRAALPLGQLGPWHEALHLAVRAGTFAATALIVVAVGSAGAVIACFGVLLATVAAPLLAALLASRLGGRPTSPL